MKTECRHAVSAIGIMVAIFGAGCNGNERFANMEQEKNAAVLLPSETGGQDRSSDSAMTDQSGEYPPYRMTQPFSESRHVAIEVRHFLVYKDVRQMNSK